MANVKKAILKGPTGCIIAFYEQKDQYKLSTSGEIRQYISWDMDGTPYESEFFADVNVKWDGCSHFRFHGEDFPNDKDSYYHICGIHSYIDFMRMFVFAYEVMVEHVGIEQMDEKEEYRQLQKLNLLDGYTIEYDYN
jgi:hypothetical protein